MKYTSRADLLIAAGESIKMQEKAGIVPSCKSRGYSGLYSESQISHCNFGDDTWSMTDYKFPLAVVEGNPVFAGDELYNIHNGMKNKITLGVCSPDDWSWNPPKPATVMVELLREDAEYIVNYAGIVSKAGEHLLHSCRKALEAK